MQLIISIRYIGLIAAMICVTASDAFCAEDSLESLAANSPFIPYDYVPSGKAGGPSGPVEFRGIMQLDDGPEFSLYDTVKNRGQWVRLQDRAAAYFVESYDAESNVLKLLMGGRSQSIPLAKRSEVAMPVGARGMMGDQNHSNQPAIEVNELVEKPIEEMTDDEKQKKREEMSKKVYDAFKRYMEQKKQREAEGK